MKHIGDPKWLPKDRDMNLLNEKGRSLVCKMHNINRKSILTDEIEPGHNKHQVSRPGRY